MQLTEALLAIGDDHAHALAVRAERGVMGLRLGQNAGRKHMIFSGLPSNVSRSAAPSIDIVGVSPKKGSTPARKEQIRNRYPYTKQAMWENACVCQCRISL